MASVNKVIIVGNLGKDPESRYLPDGSAVCNFSVATSSKYKNKAGEMIEETEWHRCNAFAKLAEVCGEYLKKGSTVYIEGNLKTRKWQNKDGQDQYVTEIRVASMQMLGGRPANSEPAKSRPATKNAAPVSSNFDDMDEDPIPF